LSFLPTHDNQPIPRRPDESQDLPMFSGGRYAMKATECQPATASATTRRKNKRQKDRQNFTLHFFLFILFSIKINKLYRSQNEK
jgi:hypothetical protein